MLNLLELALNNNFIYIGIIVVLIIIIVLTILSIKKDRDKIIKAKLVVEPAHDENERQRAKLELEKVMGEMQKSLDNKEAHSKYVNRYEEEQEEKAIISYKELVDTVRSNEARENENGEDGFTSIADIDIEKRIKTDKTTEDIINEIIKEKGVASVEKEETSEDDILNENEVSSTFEDKDLFELPKDLEDSMEEKKEEKSSSKRFQTSEFISPIFGTGPQSDFRKTEPDAIPEKKETIETKLDDIINEDFDDEDEFLDSLKDFRKNL